MGLRLGAADALGNEPYGVEPALGAALACDWVVELVMLGIHKNGAIRKSNVFGYASSRINAAQSTLGCCIFGCLLLLCPTLFPSNQPTCKRLAGPT